MKLLFFFAFTLLFSTGIISISAQGCSDAGACSIESFSARGDDMDLKNEMSLGVSYGAADHSIGVLGAQLGYTRRFGSSFSMDAKLTFASLNGNDISVSGLGDIFLMGNYEPSDVFTISGGIKIPTNEGAELNEGRSLPLDYQTSLGTFDLIFGLAYQKSNWLIALGYQQPLTQNENKFDPGDWPFGSPLSEFAITGEYERKGDVLLRLSRVLAINDKLTIVPGLLPIYHLGNDLHNIDILGNEIEGSSGLTLNGTAHVIIQTGSKGKLGFNIGFPFIVRDVRPDGLTRSFVVGAEYAVRF